jgi:fumarate hydratase, class II
MSKQDHRIEKDSMGELRVPAHALWGAQTQRAVENFPISGMPMPREFVRAVGLVKWAAAAANHDLGLMEEAIGGRDPAGRPGGRRGRALRPVSRRRVPDRLRTSTNMNANEVIATLASRIARHKIHPNDHVNMGQSSNDVIPTAIHVSAALQLHADLLPALEHLAKTIEAKAKEPATRSSRRGALT